MTDNAQLIEEMRWQLKQIEDRKAENQRLLAGISASDHTTVVSPDRSVTVLAGPGGVVSEVRLAPDAMRFDAGTLSRTITAAVRAAVTASGRVAAPPVPGSPRRAPQHRCIAAPTDRQASPDDDEPFSTIFDV